MAGISDIVSVSITRNTRTPTRAGFGVPLLLSYHTKFADAYRVYTELSDMVSDGFDTFSPAYRMASALLSQEPRVEKFVVGRLPSAAAHTQVLTITSAVEGEHVKLTVTDPTTGDETDIDYTILSSATTTSVATAVELLIEAVTGVSSTSSGANITITAAASGNVIYISDLENCTIEDTTADAGYDDELSALELLTAETDASWYAVAIDINSQANVDKVAAWVEPRVKLFFAQTADSAEALGTGDLLSDLHDAGYNRTATMFHEVPAEYAACAWMGRGLPKDPGSITWALKELAGVTVSILTPTEETNIETNYGNTYQRVAGLSLTLGKFNGGIAASGTFIDLTHGTDALTAAIQTDVLTYLVNQDKAPFEDSTGDIIEQIILAAMGRFVATKFLTAGTLTATATKVADMSLVDVGNRIFGPVKFGARLAGAAHKFAPLQGTLSL